MTSKPKDMEQLKKEARDKKLAEYEITCFNSVAIYAVDDLIKLLDKAHLSGRESMRVECRERERRNVS